MSIRFNLDKKERFSLWETPQINDSYIIGGDVAEGVEDGDFSCAQVISRRKFKQVAVWHGKIEPYEFGRELWKIGTYFNSALLAVERNAAGVATIDSLRKLDYPNLYRMVKYDQGEQEEMDRIGWITNVHSRGLMLGTLREVVRENSLILSDPDTLSEMKTFVFNKDPKKPDSFGKMMASPGNRDDRVMSLAIAVYLHQAVPWVGEVRDEVSYMDRIREKWGLPVVVAQGRGGY